MSRHARSGSPLTVSRGAGRERGCGAVSVACRCHHAGWVSPYDTVGAAQGLPSKRTLMIVDTSTCCHGSTHRHVVRVASSDRQATTCALMCTFLCFRAQRERAANVTTVNAAAAFRVT